MGPCSSCCSQLEARNQQNQSSTAGRGRAPRQAGGRLGASVHFTGLTSLQPGLCKLRQERAGVGAEGPPPLVRSLLRTVQDLVLAMSSYC